MTAEIAVILIMGTAIIYLLLEIFNIAYDHEGE